jgi:hypothetical protein
MEIANILITLNTLTFNLVLNYFLVIPLISKWCNEASYTWNIPENGFVRQKHVAYMVK